MELIWLLIAWVGTMYVIRLHRELYNYRRYFNQHNDIYVPTLNESLKMNHWSHRLLNTILMQFKKDNTTKSTGAVPDYKKKLITGGSFSIERNQN